MARPEIYGKSLDEMDDDELRYLRDRGQLTVDQEREHLGEELAEIEESVTASPVPPGGPSVSVAQTTELRTGQSHDEYDEMNKRELSDELESRDLPKSGNVEELRTRLREHDDDSADSGFGDGENE